MQRLLLFIILVTINIFAYCYIAKDIGFLPTIIFILIILSINRLRYKRICDFFKVTRVKKNIGQSIKLPIFLSLQITNNFRNNNVTRKIAKYTSKTYEDLEEYFRSTDIKVFVTATNDKMYNRLDRLKNKGVISEINVIKDKGKKVQVIEKIFFLGLGTLIMNIRNKKYWDYVFEEETVKKYKIILPNKNRVL